MPIRFIFAWNEHSEGANLLRDALGIRKIRHENSRFRGGANKTVLNWGASRLPEEVMRSTIINRPERVAEASNKLFFFRKMGENCEFVPDWTTSHTTALEWIRGGNLVCARTVLNGHSAAGLVIMDGNRRESLDTEAPLYVKYEKKAEEYRVHVIRGQVIDIQRKTLRREVAENTPSDEINWRIRNLDNGFIYQRENVELKEPVRNVALEVLRLSELDFGAVDVIWKRNNNRAYALEINTAPGITGTTVTNYANALRNIN